MFSSVEIVTMSAKRFRQLIFTVALGLAGLFIIAQPTEASESDEESPTEVAAEREQEATEKYNNGVKHMKKAKLIALVGDSAFAFNYRATSDAKAGKELEKAIKDFGKAIDLMPNFAEAYNNLGFCYRKTGKLEQSLSAYDHAIRIDSNFAQAREYRGETFLAMDDLKNADKELAYLTELKSSYADTLSLAIKLFKLAQIDQKTIEAPVSKKK